MEVKDYLKEITEEIHTTVVATIGRDGHPVTRVIDMMLSNDENIYFLTAKGKEFYRQLMEQEYLSLSGMTGEGDSIKKKAVSIQGHVKNIGKEKLEEIFEKNPYMAKIYPTEKSREALEVFCIDRGSGDYFDLSTSPITRGNFEFGGETSRDTGFYITEKCIGCGKCLEVCPQNCIATEHRPFVIRQEHCLHCGNCFSVCPLNGVEKRA